MAALTREYALRQIMRAAVTAKDAEDEMLYQQALQAIDYWNHLACGLSDEGD